MYMYCTYCKGGGFISGFPGCQFSGGLANSKWIMLQRSLDNGEVHSIQTVLHVTKLHKYIHNMNNQ